MLFVVLFHVLFGVQHEALCSSSCVVRLRYVISLPDVPLGLHPLLPFCVQLTDHFMHAVVQLLYSTLYSLVYIDRASLSTSASLISLLFQSIREVWVCVSMLYTSGKLYTTSVTLRAITLILFRQESAAVRQLHENWGYSLCSRRCHKRSPAPHC